MQSLGIRAVKEGSRNEREINFNGDSPSAVVALNIRARESLVFPGINRIQRLPTLWLTSIMASSGGILKSICTVTLTYMASQSFIKVLLMFGIHALHCTETCFV